VIFVARSTCSRIYPTSRLAAIALVWRRRRAHRPQGARLAPLSHSRFVVPAATAGRRSGYLTRFACAASAASMLAALPLPKAPRTNRSPCEPHRVAARRSIRSRCRAGSRLDLASRTSARCSSGFDREGPDHRSWRRRSRRTRAVATATPPLAYDVLVIGESPVRRDLRRPIAGAERRSRRRSSSIVSLS
jgi:hypothetical protein